MPQFAFTVAPEHLAVKPSSIEGAGQGLFTLIDLPALAHLGYYTGEELDDRGASRVPAKDQKYLVPVGRNFHILGKTKLRFINHSARPNLWMVYSYRWKKARFEAARFIRAGEELFVEYDPVFMKKMGML